jgi:hypothetical protein
MITDEDIDSLPDDPEAAFVQYEAILRKEVGSSMKPSVALEREYVAHVLAFVDTRGIPLNLPRDIPPNDVVFREWYKNFVRAVDYYRAAARLQTAARKKENVSVLTLDLDFKAQIGAHLTAIRKIVGEADISAGKRDAIFKRINNLQDEVDRDRTRTEAAFALLLDITSAISNGAKNLDPALERVERIIKVLAKAKDENEMKTLTSPKPPKRIAPPTASPEPSGSQSSADDEIPF